MNRKIRYCFSHCVTTLSIRKITFIDDELRILLTGYADLNAVMDSVNEGEIYRYITKDWCSSRYWQLVIMLKKCRSQRLLTFLKG